MLGVRIPPGLPFYLAFIIFVGKGIDKKMNKFILFLHEVKSEINKVTWPKRDEMIGSTIVVFILVVFFALLLGILDYGFSSLIKSLFGSRGL